MLIILDRDGVINYESDQYIKSPAEWVAIPGSLEAIAQLNHAGHTVVVATNQSGVGRGKYTLETMHAIHAKMQHELAQVGGHVDKIYYCPHLPEDQCPCRKPQPGMLLDIKKDFPKQFDSAVFVGDSARDLEAGLTAGCQVVLVKTGHGVKTLNEDNYDVEVYENLADFVAMLS